MNCVESASTPVGHAVTSLPSSHATHGGNTHVHEPQDSDSAFCSTSQDGVTPLMVAADRGCNDIVLELLKHGASVNTQDRVSQRPCMFPHLCEVLHSLLCLLLVDTCTCKYIVYVCKLWIICGAPPLCTAHRHYYNYTA